MKTLTMTTMLLLVLAMPMVAAQQVVEENTAHVEVGATSTGPFNLPGLPMAPPNATLNTTDSFTWIVYKANIQFRQSAVQNQVASITVASNNHTLNDCSTSYSHPSGAAPANVQLDLECQSTSLILPADNLWVNASINGAVANTQFNLWSVTFHQVRVYDQGAASFELAAADVTFTQFDPGFWLSIILMLAILWFAMWQGWALLIVPPAITIVSLFTGALDGLWTLTTGIVFSLIAAMAHYWAHEKRKGSFMPRLKDDEAEA